MSFDRKLVRSLSSDQKEAIHRTNTQKDDGILRIVSGKTKEVTSKERRIIRAVLSSETIDRYGDVILVAAWNNPRNFKNYFDNNPILLWAHGRDSNVGDLPIGSVKNPSFNTTDINNELAFEGDVIFNTDHQAAIDIGNMYLADEPSLRAFSVGFRPIIVKKEPIKEGQTGLTFLECELLENSAVPVPANPAALRRAFVNGEVSEKFIVESFFPLRELAVRNTDIFVPTSWKYKDSLNDLVIWKNEYDNNNSRNSHNVVVIKEIEEKALTHNSRLANDEPEWSSVMDNRDKLPDKAFADATGRRFPHHWIENGGEENSEGRWTSGTMYLHRSGLNAAWSAANGARSGKKASPAIISHLKTHRNAIGLGDTVNDNFANDEYVCNYCSSSQMVNLETYSEKEFHGVIYRDVGCEHCGATMSQCLEMTELLLQKSNSREI